MTAKAIFRWADVSSMAASYLLRLIGRSQNGAGDSGGSVPLVPVVGGAADSPRCAAWAP